MKQKITFLSILIISIMWISCSSDDNSIPQPTEISFATNTETLTVKDSLTLNIKHTPKDLPAPSYKYKSSNPDVAVVKNGKIIALSPGTTTITAAVSGTDLSTSIKVTVEAIKAERIVLNEITKELKVGEEFQLEATVEPEDAEDKELTWSSSDEEIVSVSDNGKIKALNKGETEVIVSTNNKLEERVKVIVTEIEVESISVADHQVTLIEGGTLTIKVEIFPENATNKKVNWKSSDDSVVSVNEDGRILAKNEGEAVVSVVSENGVKEEIEIMVEPKYVEIGKSYVARDGLTVTVNSISIDKNAQGTYSYTISYLLENSEGNNKISEGSFQMNGPDDGARQNGFFSYVYPGESISRSYVFKSVNGLTELEYIYPFAESLLFPENNELFWKVSE